MEEAAAADYVRTAADPGNGAAAAQPAARGATGGSASHTVTADGALASGEGEPGPAGTVAAGSSGGAAPSEGDTTSADRMHMHMNVRMNEMTEVGQPERKKMRVKGGRAHWARDHDND